MQLVHGKARILKVADRKAGIELLRHIEYCARKSRKSENRMTSTSWERFIESNVLHHGDWSITEHASVSVEFILDRAIGEEQVRHRLFSFTKESTRFLNYLKAQGMRFIYPRKEEVNPRWAGCIEHCEKVYRELIDLDGWKPEDARTVLPLALVGEVAMTGNLRNWRHVLIMRTTKQTHHQFRHVMDPLLRRFQQRIPLLFDDIKPGMSQSEAVRLPR